MSRCLNMLLLSVDFCFVRIFKLLYMLLGCGPDVYFAGIVGKRVPNPKPLSLHPRGCLQAEEIC